MDHLPYRNRPNRAAAHEPINNGGINADNGRRPAGHRLPNQEPGVDNDLPDVAMWLLSVPYPQLRHRVVYNLTRVTSVEWMLLNWDLLEAVFSTQPDSQAIRQLITQRVTAFTAPLILPIFRQKFVEWYMRLNIPGAAILNCGYRREVTMPVPQVIPPHPIEVSLRSMEFYLSVLPWECQAEAIGIKVEVNRLFAIHERSMMDDGCWQAVNGAPHQTS
ncbi:hypothetical protein FHETE_5581 [Fusarium heterosporum]|uniref:Uncharacterized protein n=1 Tax=Fusarium heterosporum TaxID=42747 RepID=A0A8H5TDY0_FUSHE|nr:hypothetical protein FHETE_5581 [Fusarium heterosporum]